MSRADVLSSGAMEFLDSQGCLHEQSLDFVLEMIPETIRLSTAQVRAIATLGGVVCESYFARETSFFPGCHGDGIPAYLYRNAAETGREAELLECLPSSCFELEPLWMSPSGALEMGVTRDRIGKVYDSPYVVVERDAFLAARGFSKAQGFVNLKPWVVKPHLVETLQDLTIHEPASDSQNLIWYSDDMVLVYEAWFHLMLLDNLPRGAAVPRYGDMVTVFGKNRNALSFAKERLSAFEQIIRVE